MLPQVKQIAARVQELRLILDMDPSEIAEKIGVEVTCLQSNHEGDLVDYIQSTYGAYDGIVINPGAYTHTSIAILDAVKSVSVPTVEVHISKVDEREDFRKISYIRAACIATVSGHGTDGYLEAMDLLKAKGDAVS